MKPEDTATRFPALASELTRLNHDAGWPHIKGVRGASDAARCRIER